MRAVSIIAYIAAAILLFFGVLFIWGAFSPQGQVGWVFIGLVSVVIGFGLVAAGYLTGRKAAQTQADSQNVTLKIDLPADVSLDTFKCQSCGGTLTMENIQMVAGAPVVSCPYCKTTYQLKEEPKW